MTQGCTSQVGAGVGHPVRATVGVQRPAASSLAWRKWEDPWVAVDSVGPSLRQVEDEEDIQDSIRLA